MSGYRLTSDVRSELTWLWCYADGDLGMCHGANIESRGIVEKSDIDEDEFNKLGLMSWKCGPRGSRAASKKESKQARIAKRDEELRLMFQTIVCKGDGHVSAKDDPVDCTMASGGEPFVMDRTPMPQWAMRINSPERKKATRIHRTLQLLIGAEDGIVHHRVLYRVYGPVQRHPVCYGRIGEELAPLVEYTDVVAELIRSGMTPTDAGESLLRKGNEVAAHRVKGQAEKLLQAASHAYSAAHHNERKRRTQDREAKFRALLRAS